MGCTERFPQIFNKVEQGPDEPFCQHQWTGSDDSPYYRAAAIHLHGNHPDTSSPAVKFQRVTETWSACVERDALEREANDQSLLGKLTFAQDAVWTRKTWIMS
ncbi:hypothetical protein DNTS_011818 [Danionella cerebrum]|uniref:Uncharacterized protein n=1 Tax=Danionella cerebrum TaxID=2873325 RepID=A0A553QKE2_9TELE|nr:hypothetical protein DNTS_011818 [Danionella translucida]